MTAMSHGEFVAALNRLNDQYPTALDLPTWVLGECDTCGEDTNVRATNHGLQCQDCADTDPEPYDFADCYEVPDNGWGW
ncbi:MAG: hypothetical protein IE923_04400 [Micrococcales bacterium]|nr:hypothetical protein [Micrococcales bacterium]